MSVLNDIRLAWRTLVRSRGFSALALGTLALGISASAAIFSLMDATLFRPLPYAAPGQLMRITADLTRLGSSDVGVSAAELDDYRRATDLFSAVSGLYPANANLTGIDEPERIEGQLVSPEYLSLLGVTPAIGRDFRPEDAGAGLGTVAIITDSLWRRRFNSDPDIAGRVVRLDTDPIEIIGVLPPGFQHPGTSIASEPEFFQPARYAGASFGTPSRANRRLGRGALARLAPGVTVEAAQTRLAALASSIRSTYAGDYPDTQGWTPRLIPLRDDLFGSARDTLWILAAAVGALLLIACANVANMLLARGTVRQREFAVRRALGASPARLVRQLLTESLVLGLGAGLAGALGASWLLAALTTLIPAELTRVTTVALDGRVLAFTIVTSILTVMIFGLWPALQVAAGSSVEAIKEGGRSTSAGAHTSRARRVLVIAECALALALAVTAALLGRSFAALYSVNAGFDAHRLLTARSWMPLPNNPDAGPYLKHEAKVSFYRRSLEALNAVPGIQQAAWISRLPLTSRQRSLGFLIQGQAPDQSLHQTAEQLLASPAYFSTVGVPVLAGRSFSDADHELAPRVLVVSASLVARYFPNGDALGAQVRPGGPNSNAPWHTIIGIVGDMRSARLDTSPHPQFYRSLWQTSDLEMSLVARTVGDPMAVAGLAREAVRGIDPDLPLYAVQSMEDVMADSLGRQRLAMAVTGTFAALALVLAALGIYSTLAYQVLQRRGEIGIRIALGASPRAVVLMVIRNGLALVSAGAVIGLGLAALSGRAVRGVLFEVSALDLPSYAAITALLMLVAVAACAIPARRASRIDPLDAMRS
jgi:predicted permease